MVKLQKIVVVLLIITLVLSITSIAFNIVIYKMKSFNLEPKTSSLNSGNIGFVVEKSTKEGLDG